MKALILAGGLGTRLRPLTYARPKHLLPIANRPHIEHVLGLLESQGVVEVVLLTSYLADTFGDVIRRAEARGMRVEVTHEPERLGTAGAIKNAESLLGDETFFVFNGDILTDLDLELLVRVHRSESAELTMFLTPVEDPSAFGVVPTDPSGRVQAFIEKPPPGTAPTDLINAGIYIMEPRVLGLIPEGEVWSAERALFPDLVAAGRRVFAAHPRAYWMDIGTPDKYLAANLDALEGTFRTDAVADPGPGAALIDPSAEVSAAATVSASCVGRGSGIDEGAIVQRSVLLPGVHVGAGAKVSGSVLGEGARVGPGVEVIGRTIADGEIVESV
jgi:mannose-1-phosphate guanylyltransferase